MAKIQSVQSYNRSFAADYYVKIEGEKCVYCGYKKECYDHVLPVSEFIKRPWNDWSANLLQLVPCCKLCNITAKGHYFTSFENKQDWVVREILRAYGYNVRKNETIIAFIYKRKLVEWSKCELEELGYNLRTYIESSRFLL